MIGNSLAERRGIPIRLPHLRIADFEPFWLGWLVEGVLCDRATQLDVFFITLKKSERLFSATGQRYFNQPVRGSRVMLPFLCLGFADYVSHEAERIWFFPECRSAGGVAAGDGVGGLNSQHLSRFVHPSSSSEPSRILRARLRWLANSTNSACSSAEVSKPG